MLLVTSEPQVVYSTWEKKSIQKFGKDKIQTNNICTKNNINSKVQFKKLYDCRKKNQLKCCKQLQKKLNKIDGKNPEECNKIENNKINSNRNKASTKEKKKSDVKCKTKIKKRGRLRMEIIEHETEPRNQYEKKM